MEDQNQTEKRNRAVQLPDGSTALISDTPGFTLNVQGSGPSISIEDEATWADLHKQVQTGKLKFVTVKKRLKQDS